MNLDDLKLRTKALIPLAVMAFVIVCMVGFGAFKLSAISGAASDIIERRDMAAVKLIRASREMLLAPYAVFGSLVFDGDGKDGQRAIEGFPKAVAKAVTNLDDALALMPKHAAELNGFKDRFLALAEKSKKPLQIGKDTPGLEHGGKLKPGDLDLMAEGARIMGEVDGDMRQLIADVVDFNENILAENAKAAGDLHAQSTYALMTMAAAGLVSVLLAGWFSMWMSSVKITNPLAQLAGQMKALAKGNLAVEIEGQSRKDEVGDMAQAVQVFKLNALEQVRLEAEAVAARSLAEAERERAAAERARAVEEQTQAVSRLGDGLKNLASGDLTIRLSEGFSENYLQIKNDFNEAIDKLKMTIQTVVSSADVIQSGTQEISTASEDLSRRTEQQAASLEETAAALDEITATVKKAAQGANHAREVVAEADDDAKKSAVVVRQAVDAMDAIAKSAQQISQIIGVIDEIAFQTNLLALNAGVEAARAGDAGRGFAVVASEVRALAQRSAEAAKEIKGLISASTAQVEQGVRLVGETGKSLERIMSQVTEINIVVSEIAAGAQEQATGLVQVNTAINQMDQVTQQNAAMVEESTAASLSLSRETEQLSGLVGRFRVGEGGGDHAMRQALQKAAPHAFKKPAKAPPRAAAPVRAAPKAMAANGGADNWEEF